MQFMEVGITDLRSAALGVGGCLDADADTAEQLEWLTSGTKADWANLHCVQVITNCWRIVAGIDAPVAEAAHGLAPAQLGAFRHVAQLCRLNWEELDWILGSASAQPASPRTHLYRV